MSGEFLSKESLPSERINLEAIREAAGMSRRDLGHAMGYRGGREVASTVSQMERRQDWLMSRLIAYIKAAGATAELTVKVNGEELRFEL